METRPHTRGRPCGASAGHSPLPRCPSVPGSHSPRWVLEEAVAPRTVTWVTGRGGARPARPPRTPRRLQVTTPSSPTRTGREFQAADHRVILPGPDPRAPFLRGLSHALHNGGARSPLPTRNPEFHGLHRPVCNGPGSGSVLRVPSPLGPCVPRQGMPGGRSGPREPRRASICLCLSSETTARQARSRPRVPRPAQSRSGRAGRERLSVPSQTRKGCCSGGFSANGRIRGWCPAVRAPPAKVFCYVSCTAACGHTRAGSEDSLCSRKVQMG